MFMMLEEFGEVNVQLKGFSARIMINSLFFAYFVGDENHTTVILGSFYTHAMVFLYAKTYTECYGIKPHH